jgi:hypothetical protein
METCFNCHGIAHGPQGELASGKCTACHTPSFKLRPADHTADWKGKPHAARGKTGVNSCMMCHNAKKDCDVCHTKEGVKVAGKPIVPMPETYTPIVPLKVKRPSVMVYPDRPTSMGQCIYCHPDIDAFNKGRIIFAHAEHLRRDYKCTVCHPTFGHGAETVQRPPMQTCYQCHGLVHSASGLVATEKCDACHPKGFDLKPTDHTKAFVAGGHKTRAEADQPYCAMCHQSKFCIDCHQGRKLLVSGFYSPRVVPADHKRADWNSKHGPLYLEQKGSCASCHDSPSCQTCHYTPMPHPADWQAQHGKQARSIDPKARDCNVCHTDRERCQECHHDKVKRAKLTATSCASGPGYSGCHPEMAKEPFTSIKQKTFAEHAVHFFDVTKKGKDKREPFTCDDCHVGFGTSGATHKDQQALQQGHDVRLCYGCHGALDYENKAIAPWPGAQLCLRCHSNLNI